MKILTISNLKKVYKNGKIALDNISLSVNKGEFLALLGPNGAGKSTLINILADSVVKTAGNVEVCNFNLDKDKINFKRSIGIVPQDLNFDPFFNPFEVLSFQQGLYGITHNKEKILTLLENLGLKDQTYSYARNLSGGMKRRLLVAKALIHNPDVIILDEPTAGVDIELRQHLWEFLKNLNSQGKTIILTTHYLEEAQYLCDKVAIINKGKLITYEDKNTLINKIGKKTLEIILNKEINNNFNLSYNYSKIENNKIMINYKEDKDVGTIVSQIVNSKFDIVSLKMQESSLEEVFLSLTSSERSNSASIV